MWFLCVSMNECFVSWVINIVVFSILSKYFYWSILLYSLMYVYFNDGWFEMDQKRLMLLRFSGKLSSASYEMVFLLFLFFLNSCLKFTALDCCCCCYCCWIGLTSIVSSSLMEILSLLYSPMSTDSTSMTRLLLLS